tara:strand:+ start:116 stop:361 length:246 start_codon:yes stop_codon:yes gene_type:complete
MILEVFGPSPLEGQELQTATGKGLKAYSLTFYGSNCTTLQLCIKNSLDEVIDSAVLQVSDSGRLQLRRKRTPGGDKSADDS